MQGWIKLHREIKSNWLYQEKRTFSKFEAWIDLLLEVNHKDNRVLLGSELIDIQRGQTVTSIRQLCDRWGWSNTKVKQFLSLLQNDGMITVKSDTKKTVITVDKYDFYQCIDEEKTTQNTHENDTKQTRKHTNKNVKNDKNVKNEKKKHIYAEFVSMLPEEYEKLVSEYGEQNTKRMIEVLDNYKGANGKKYKSDYRAILNWVKDRVIGEKGGGRAGKNQDAAKAAEQYEIPF